MNNKLLTYKEISENLKILETGYFKPSFKLEVFDEVTGEDKIIYLEKEEILEIVKYLNELEEFKND